MQELLTYIVTAIVHHPEAVTVSQVESEDGQHITVRLSVHADDMGLIIGKDGNIAMKHMNGADWSDTSVVHFIERLGAM